MPSGREKGPEKSTSTRREALSASFFGTWTRCGEVNAASAEAKEGAATLGGHEPSSSARCAISVRDELKGSQGNDCSSKYTSDAPGDRMLQPRLMPTQARGSMRVFEYACLGLTA
eukprot:6106493-Pleurochrysis_carterae.AAC.3